MTKEFRRVFQPPVYHPPWVSEDDYAEHDLPFLRYQNTAHIEYENSDKCMERCGFFSQDPRDYCIYHQAENEPRCTCNDCYEALYAYVSTGTTVSCVHVCKNYTKTKPPTPCLPCSSTTYQIIVPVAFTWIEPELNSD